VTTKRACACVTLIVGVCCAVSTMDARTFSSETEFLQAVVAPITVSFNQFPVGFLPQTTLQLGGVTVRLTMAGFAPIFGPPALGFSTNFLSTGVEDGGNNVVITFAAGTRGAGMKIASPSTHVVTMTATYFSGSEVVTFSSLPLSFLGVLDESGLQSITFSSPNLGDRITPIVNIGDITYALRQQVPVPAGIPALSDAALLILALSLLLAGGMALRHNEGRSCSR
jgi:hypothetical protein